MVILTTYCVHVRIGEEIFLADAFSDSGAVLLHFWERRDILDICNYSKGEVMPGLADNCANEVFEVTPLVMRTIRQSMRAHSAHDLSVPQFRTLAYVDRHTGASLSDVAEHLGLTLSSVSRLVDGLVTRALLVREASAADRRYLTLRITTEGEAVLAVARQATRQDLAELVGALPPAEQELVMQAMRLLREVFAKNVQRA